MGQPKTYNAALYLRLSKDDGTENESSSIQTQKEMLTRYCRENGFVIADYYIDDGYSGKNFERPDFKRMIGDIKEGKVNCVITKDLSRLGRNHIETSLYIEVYFPENGVRYIALTDGVDTYNNTAMDITPFKNLLNDMYIQDISRKVKSALLTRQKQGKFIGVKAPYGYLKDPNDKNHLIIDERFAPIIRRIYAMARDGMGLHQIKKVLRAEKIPRPAAAAAEMFDHFERYCDTDERVYAWSMGSVREILQNPVYKGAIRGQKRPKISYRSEKRKNRADAGTFVVEGMHEPIIDPEEWELVRRLITARKRTISPNTKPYNNIFSGLVKCADCGYALTASRSNKTWNDDDINANYDYYCNSYRTEGKAACTKHRICASELHRVVSEDIKRLAAEALDDDEGMIASIIESLGNADKEQAKRAEREIKKAQKRLAELDKLYAKLYEDNANGSISGRNYKTLTANYEREQAELESKIDELSKTVSTSRESDENAANFVDLIKGYSDISELTQALLNTLIDRIEIHEPEEIDGEYVQLVDIYYKFVGMID
ncbi:MAG: recombinase family protein [Oscillospiraceae bacterium]|nr:recombinase family protein [Oscillospiraceae bacterium]